MVKGKTEVKREEKSVARKERELEKRKGRLVCAAETSGELQEWRRF